MLPSQEIGLLPVPRHLFQPGEMEESVGGDREPPDSLS